MLSWSEHYLKERIQVQTKNIYISQNTKKKQLSQASEQACWFCMKRTPRKSPCLLFHTEISYLSGTSDTWRPVNGAFSCVTTVWICLNFVWIILNFWIHTELGVFNGTRDSHAPKIPKNLTGNEERRLNISLWMWVCPLMWCGIEHVICWCLIHTYINQRSVCACFETNLGHFPWRKGQRRCLCAELQSCHKELTGWWDSKRDLL